MCGLSLLLVLALAGLANLVFLLAEKKTFPNSSSTWIGDLCENQLMLLRLLLKMFFNCAR